MLIFPQPENHYFLYLESMKQRINTVKRRVKEATKLWCTWMDEILTNFRENGQHHERRVKGEDVLYGAS